MVLVRSHSADESTASNSSRARDSGAGTACSNSNSNLLLLPLVSTPLEAAVTRTVSTSDAAEVLIASSALDGGGDSSGRHTAHRWMRADVAAAIRNIHNTKKATIKQHY